MNKRTVYTITDDLAVEANADGTVDVLVGSRDLATLTRDEALEAAVALLSGWADMGAWEGERNGIHPGRHAHALRRYLGLGGASGDQ